MTSENTGDEDAVPEVVLNWIAAGRPDPLPAAVARWREGHEHADAEIDAISRVWSAAEPPEFPAGGLEDLRSRIARSVPSGRREWTWPLQAAAAVLLLSVGAVAGTRLIDAFRSAPDALTRVEVPAGATVSLQLPGDIAVQLNAGSSLTYAADDGEIAEVTLDGEGFFRVRHDPARTFTVRTAAGVIRDIGTEFGVQARDSSVSVVVTEGIVALEAAGEAVEVGAGYTSRARHGQAPTPAAPADLEVALAWTEGRIVFIDETLGSIAAELSRRFGVAIDVAPSLLGQKVTASVGPPADIENVLRLITLAAGERYERVATGWRITPR